MLPPTTRGWHSAGHRAWTVRRIRSWTARAWWAHASAEAPLRFPLAGRPCVRCLAVQSQCHKCCALRKRQLRGRQQREFAICCFDGFGLLGQQCHCSAQPSCRLAGLPCGEIATEGLQGCVMCRKCVFGGGVMGLLLNGRCTLSCSRPS